MYLLTGLLAFAFLSLYFYQALQGAELHADGFEVWENPLQKLLWKLAGKWTGYLFVIFFTLVLFLTLGGLIANKLGAIPGSIYFGAGLLAIAAWWPKKK